MRWRVYKVRSLRKGERGGGRERDGQWEGERKREGKEKRLYYVCVGGRGAQKKDLVKFK